MGDQARLLVAISTSVETLHLKSDPVYQMNFPCANEEQVRAAMAHLSKGQQRRKQSVKLGTADADDNVDASVVFSHLRALTLEGQMVDTRVLLTLIERSPVLEELNLDTCYERSDDATVAKYISSVRSQGWKTLGFKCPNISTGPLTVAAVLNHSATLENLRLPDCPAFSSPLMQKFLCSAPNLKRFDTIGFTTYGELEPFSLMANDILESMEDWVCLGLRSFKCRIGGIPRPDLRQKTNGRPLTSVYNDPTQYTMEQSRSIQQQVLEKIGRLEQLHELTLGVDNVDQSPLNEVTIECEMDNEGFYCDEGDIQLGVQYQCLTLSLQDGLDRLQGLKSMRRFLHEKMQATVMQKSELQWIRKNWPEYKKDLRDDFWTSRGHYVCAGPISTPAEDDEDYNFDWW